MRVILVGNVDPLPSVGTAIVLRDIIDSDCMPVVGLEEIFFMRNVDKDAEPNDGTGSLIQKQSGQGREEQRA